MMTAIGVAGIPATSHAQIEGWISTSSTTSLGVSSLAGTIVLIVVLASPSKRGERLQPYLNENQVAVHEALRGGVGASEDLAAMFGVELEHRAAFAKMLREQRAELSALLPRDGSTLEQASQFAELIIAGDA
jgi:hypothetical protein